jgi:hypothetical protein
MADYFSDHFAPQTGTAGIVGPATDNGDITRSYRAPVGFAHARYRIKQARFTTSIAGVAATGIIHMMKFKSGDRLYGLFVSDTGASDDLAADCGLYVVENDGSGTLTRTGVLGDVDLFGAANALNAGATRTDLFSLGALSAYHKGMTLWQLANVGAATHTSDPFVEYYISLTVTTDAATAAETVVLEAQYTSGD